MNIYIVNNYLPCKVNVPVAGHLSVDHHAKSAMYNSRMIFNINIFAFIRIFEILLSRENYLNPHM